MRNTQNPFNANAVGVGGYAVSSSDMSTAASISDAPGAGLKLVLDRILISVGSTALRVDIREESLTNVFLSVYLPVNGSIFIDCDGRIKLTTATKKLQAIASASGQITITPFWHTEP